MSSENTLAALNQLVALHHRSLARYLMFAAPMWHHGDEQARETLKLMAEDQSDLADRLAAMVVERGGLVNTGKFPIYYTGFHDLSFEFLLDELIKEERQAIATIEQCVEALRLVPQTHAIAAEALGAAKGHLESLEELKQSEPA